MGNSDGGLQRNNGGSDDDSDATRIDRPGSPDSGDNQSDGGIQPYTFNIREDGEETQGTYMGNERMLQPGSPNSTTIVHRDPTPEPERSEYSYSIREFEFEGHTIRYAVHGGYPWFFLGTFEENRRHEHLWREGRLPIPDVYPPEPYSDTESEDEECCEYDELRPDTPDIYDIWEQD